MCQRFTVQLAGMSGSEESMVAEVRRLQPSTGKVVERNEQRAAHRSIRSSATACARGSRFRNKAHSPCARETGVRAGSGSKGKAQMTLLLKSKAPKRMDSQKWHGGTAP